jgi:hypothetical protein
VVVLGIIGFCAWNEFSIKGIVFVNDKTISSPKGNEIVINRLYNSGVNIEKFNNKVQESVVNAEFAEEDIEQAALLEGTPEFYPQFNLSMYSENDLIRGESLKFKAIVTQQVAKGQSETNFAMKHLRLEAQSNGITIADPWTTIYNEDLKTKNTPVIDEAGNNLMLPAENTVDFGFYVNGTKTETGTERFVGTITLNFIYDVYTESIFSSVVIKDCLLSITANVSSDTDGRTTIEFIPEKYATLADLTE